MRVFAHLCEDEGLRVAAVQAEDKADRLEQFLDAGAKLVLLHAAGGPRVKDPRLHDKLEEVLESLRTDAGRNTTHSIYTGTDFCFILFQNFIPYKKDRGLNILSNKVEFFISIFELLFLVFSGCDGLTAERKKESASRQHF